MSLVKANGAGEVSTGFYNGVIDQSLRFGGYTDGAELSRTPSSASNRKTWTLSTWVKRSGDVDAGGSVLLGAFASSYSDFIYFDTSDRLTISFGNAHMVGTNAVFRDRANWFHVVVAVDVTESTDTDRVKIYINGTQQTLQVLYASFPSNTNYAWNNTVVHTVGGLTNFASYQFDGYLAEYNFIDGSALTPSSFGETKNGVWIPKKISGLTYGTNGFRLTFADSSDIGNNANSTDGTNDYSPSNLASTDVVPDSPENSFCVLNPLGKQSASALSEGNLKTVITSGTNSGRTPATFAVNSGKWYYEVRQSSSNRFGMGVFDTEKYVMANEDGGVDQYEWVLVTDDTSGAAQLVNNSNYTSGYGGTAADGHVIMVALDVDNGAIWFGKQGSWFNKGTSDNSATVKSQIEAGTTTNAAFTSVTGRLTPSFIRQTSNNTINVNFGQDDTFAGNETTAGNTDSNGNGSFQYEPPSSFLALCSANLPDVTIGPDSDTQADDHFNTVLYTANNQTAQSITGVGFQPDWMWFKQRSRADSHALIDTSRGIDKAFRSNATDLEYDNSNSETLVTAVGADGFTLGTDAFAWVNYQSDTMVAWNWKANGGTTTTNDASSTGVGTIDSVFQANTTSGLSILTYTGTGSAGTVKHGLSVAPSMVIIKSRAGASVPNWVIGQDAYTGFTGQMYFDTGAFSSNSGSFNNTAPTTSVVSIGTDSTVNQSTATYVMYCFANVEGYSKIGSYVGNNSTDGTFVYTGFRPAFVMVKYASGSGEDWIVWDKLRDPDNLVHNKLYWNTSNAEITDTTNRMMDFLSNGFKHRTGHVSTNGNGGTYIYLAFAEQPFKFSNAR